MNLTHARTLRGAAVLWLLGTALACADPWAPPGDLALRSDLQLLADEGIVRTPLTSWPLSWADVSRDLDAVASSEPRTPSVSDALARLRREARRQTRVGVVTPHVEVSLAELPTTVRGFDDVPREQGEVGGGLDWIGERFAARVELRRVWDPSDGKRTRLDGSYVGVTAGNVMISAGYMEKWWGPGWAGSLILSSNARPVPSITIERNYSDASRLPVLEWFGPWRASFQAGRLEGERNDYPHAHFMALRIAARPLRGLEVGVSRTAQLCGDGRRCTPRTYRDMVTGNDNDQALADQPGNQMAGFDFRWAVAQRVPVAIYGQAIGEDEAGFLPSKYLGLGGVETWGRLAARNWRAYAEYARTSCDFQRSRPQYGCAYESSIYTDGYRFRQRAIGHAWDRDAAGWTAGLVVTGDRHVLHARAYDTRLNRPGTGAAHSLAPAGGSLRGVEAGVRLDTRFGRFRLAVGYDDADGRGMRARSGASAFVQWQHRL